MVIDGIDTGFSVDLLNAVAAELDLAITYDRKNSFSEMLGAVQDGSVDAAIANISITAERERLMDFSQPIFESGVQVMMSAEASSSTTMLKALFTRQIGLAVLAALVLLFGGGMLMWVFERHKQPYFDRSARDAAFPAFWWALNLVVNGGFEERMPQSRPGRFFAVILVVSSLFIVSIFVAQITAALTISAIQSNIETINDLDGRPVGTIAGSTSAAYLDQRGIAFREYADLQTLLVDFEEEALDAVVFDGPILAYYVRTQGNGGAHLLERVYKPENYGMVFQTGSNRREDVDQAMLRLREDGTYEDLLIKWFGAAYARR
jgi:polar amino acid transport system substrate-binding protein